MPEPVARSTDAGEDDGPGATPVLCRRPGCGRPVVREGKVGRPRSFCGKACSDQFKRNRRKALGDLTYALRAAAQYGLTAEDAQVDEEHRSSMTTARDIVRAAVVAAEATVDDESAGSADTSVSAEHRAVLLQATAALNIALTHLRAPRGTH